MSPYSSKDNLVTFWGVDSERPNKVIENVTLLIEGDYVETLAEATHDLADINVPMGVYLMQSSNVIYLYLKGGDAAGAYTAILEIKGNKVVSRKIEFVNSSGDLDVIYTEYSAKKG